MIAVPTTSTPFTTFSIKCVYDTDSTLLHPRAEQVVQKRTAPPRGRVSASPSTSHRPWREYGRRIVHEALEAILTLSGLREQHGNPTPVNALVVAVANKQEAHERHILAA